MIASIALSIGKALLGYAESRADKDLERFRIQAGIDKSEVEAKVRIGEQAASVMKAGMQFPIFWVPWSIAAVSLSLWFSWGVLDSLANGALPDVAQLPPQLAAYADVVWANIFYAGAGMAGIQSGARLIAGALRR